MIVSRSQQQNGCMPGTYQWLQLINGNALAVDQQQLVVIGFAVRLADDPVAKALKLQPIAQLRVALTRNQRGDRWVVSARRLRFGCSERHLNPNAGAFILGALQGDVALHQAHQLLADSQAQTGAAVAARGAAVGLGKGVEQLALGLFRNADTGIAHRALQ